VPEHLQLLIIPRAGAMTSTSRKWSEVIKFLEERDAKVKFLKEVSL
jgi:hypothetical protein